MSNGLNATDSRVRFGDLLQVLETDTEVVLVDREGVNTAVGVPAGSVEALQGRLTLSEWVERMAEARALVARALVGHERPTASELIDGGRDDFDAQ
jgi:hypothetical protein